nr:enoyl-CoA hydratase-related protein [Microlunatus panaciterrae]
MDRPEALNAVSTEQAAAIAAACAELASDPSVRAVVLSSSASRAFCVGADLKERAGFSDEDLRAQRPVARAAYGGVLGLPVPVIAAVEGYALGGGCELALACDLIVASNTAVFALPEVGVGLIPGGGGTQLLPRRIGWNRAADLIFSTRRVGAEEALQIGLADRRVPAGLARLTAVELAEGIATRSPVAVRNAKAALRRGFDVGLPAGLEIEDLAWADTAFSADRAEGIAAFNEKRAPRWPDPPAGPGSRSPGGSSHP